MKKKTTEITIHSSAAEYLTFIAATGGDERSFEMRYQNENIWLTQKMMAALYDVSLATVNEHIAKIYNDRELTQEATIRNFRIVQTEGARWVERDVKHYNLQMNIAVGLQGGQRTGRAVPQMGGANRERPYDPRVDYGCRPIEKRPYVHR